MPNWFFFPQLVKSPLKIESCSQQEVELRIYQFWIVSLSDTRLPLQVEDASRPEPAEGDEEALKIRVNQDTRLVSRPRNYDPP